jgi:hypothetical protein
MARSKKTTPPRTPRPYRIWFNDYEGAVPPDLEAAIATAVERVDRKNAALARDFGFGSEERWDVSQETGELRLQFADGHAVRAQVQIVGSFDGETWMWAWANESVLDERKRAAQTLRTIGRRKGWDLLTTATWPADPADGLVLGALACDRTRAAGTFMVRTAGGSLIVLCVETPERVAASRKARPARSRRKDEDDDPSPFALIHELLADQMDGLELPLTKHVELSRLCNEAHEAVVAGRFGDGVAKLEEAWSVLPECQSDYVRPAGWILCAWGNALFLDGKKARAREKLLEALSCSSNPLIFLRLGQCAADRSAREVAYLQCWLAGGRDAFGDDGSALEALDAALASRRAALDERVAAAMRKEKKKGSGEDERRARSLVRCFIEDFCAFERTAASESEAASVHREEAHVLSDEDLVVDAKNDERWAELLATYCTPDRSPRCPGYQSPPAHDPKKERIVSCAVEGDRIEVRTQAKDVVETDWLYVLVRREGRWLIEEVFSCWDDGEQLPSLQ